MIIKRVIGRETRIAKSVGPMARDALGAIGRPSDVEEICIEHVSDDYTFDG